MPRPIEVENSDPSAAGAGGAAASSSAPTPQEITAAADSDLVALEEDNINNSTNLSGGHEAVDVPSPPQRVAVRTPGTRTRANKPPIDASQCKTTREVINLYSKKGTKQDPMPHDDELRIRLQGELENLASQEYHDDLWIPSKKTKCKCLHHLLKGEDHNIRAVIANWLVESMKRPKEEEDREIATWIRYASKGQSKSTRQDFLVPYSNVYADTKNIVADLTDAHYNILNHHTLCTSGIALLMQRGRSYWSRVKGEVFQYGIPKPHALKGKKRAMDDSLFDGIKDFWSGIEAFAEVRATKTIRTITGLEAQGDDDGVVHLPQYFSLRNLYGRYLDELGYDMKQYGNGSYEVLWREVAGDMKKPYVQLTTFYNVWKQHFGHIKVSNRVEDICVLCYQFMHRNKFMKHTGSCDSHADVSLFQCQECGDGGENGNGDGADEEELPPLSEHQYDGDESIAEEEPSASTTAPTTTQPTSEHEEDLIDLLENVESLDRENMILRAERHVKMAQAQRMLYVNLVHKARQHVRLKLPFNRRSFTFVVDYGQNMELPVFNHEQPGCSYYYSPLSVYNLGMVDQAYAGPNGDDYGNPRDHMHLHVYHEGVGKKGANNVASLIMKTLELKNLLKPGGETGGELNIIFDNCTGQNKNNTVLKLMVWLTEMGYFKKVNFVFLIVGHTKNAADRIFNLVKLQYRLRNLYTFRELTEACATSQHVTVHPTTVEDFKDWEKYLDNFYTDYSGMVKQNHIFSCSYEANKDGNKLNAHLQESDLPGDAITKKNVIKQTFLGRRLLFGNSSYSEAVNARPQIMQAALDGNLRDADNNIVGQLDIIESNGINIFKRVEMAYKYKKIIPVQFSDDELYATPPPEVFEAVKKEKVMRKSARETINAEKQKVVKKMKLQAKGEPVAKGGE